jgi:magnesium-transporting ATPase (P-type)
LFGTQVNVFKSYHDTVLSLGLSHISQNDNTFTSSDLAFGIDILFQTSNEDSDHQTSSKSCFLSHHRKELLFVSKIASNSCVFNLSFGQSGLLNMAEILGRGRGALSSGTSSGYFVIYASVVYTLTIFMCTFSASTPIPVIPASSVILYIQVFVPLIALSMAFSREKKESMSIVPPKNDPNITFGNGRYRAIFHMVIRSLIPAGASGLVFLISFGELIKELDPEILESLNLDSSMSHWTSVMRCDGLSTYVGQASLASSNLMLSELTLCVIAQSISFLFGNDPISNPMRKNFVWTIVSLSCVAIVMLHLNFVLPAGCLQALPWYFYLIALAFPLISLAFCEVVKKKNKHFEQRSEKLRRLQFETRLGMWSPK